MSFSISGRGYSCSFELCETTAHILNLQLTDDESSRTIGREGITVSLFDDRQDEMQLLAAATRACTGESIFDRGRTIATMRLVFQEARQSYDGFTGLNREQFLTAVNLLSRWSKTEHFCANEFYKAEILGISEKNPDLNPSELAAISECIDFEHLHNKQTGISVIFANTVWPTLRETHANYATATSQIRQHAISINTLFC